MGLSGEKIYGGIEAGGTKFVGAVGNGPDNLKAIDTFPTTDPQTTLQRAADFFLKIKGNESLAALGIASFGPLDLNPESSRYGSIVTTPKQGWSDTDLAGFFQEKLAVPVILDTDVNGAALAERTWGVARGLDPVVYLTIGTGIGGGGIINDNPMHGISHPEMGHIRIPHDINEDPFPGCCPYHGDCLEGLASGAAMEKRWGQSPKDIPGEHEAWELEASYLALAVVNYIYTLAPQMIIMGGGIMKKDGLLPRIRERVMKLMQGYGPFPESPEDIASYIVRPGLGDHSGVLGAIALARNALEKP